jgi:hypothetical protein
MRPYGLYLRKCPGVNKPRDFKVGIAALDKIRTRLAAYQQAVGPVYTEEFVCLWIGEDIDVKEAEKKIKQHFKHKIASAEAGLSEWISNIDRREILDFIEELKTEHFIKLEEAPDEFVPLTMNNVQDFLEWFEVWIIQWI